MGYRPPIHPAFKKSGLLGLPWAYLVSGSQQWHIIVLNKSDGQIGAIDVWL